MKTDLVLGIMSGTSIDSVDYAVCAVGARRVELVRHWQVDFPAALRRRLHQAARGELASWDFCQAHHDLGRFYARHAVAKGKGPRPMLAGLHGQTVFHNPDPKAPATFQMGEPVYLAQALGAPVVNNFRVADMAAGGQGAPLATMFHLHAYGERGRHVCVNNLGGISNVTSLDWRRGASPRVMAFDTGPANVLMDMAMRHYTGGKKHFDRNGAWAAQGQPEGKLLARWLRHPYFLRPPPKSTGRELFGEPFFREALRQMERLSPQDALATFTEFTARSLALNYRMHLRGAPDRVILCGGGAANPVLAAAIERELAQAYGRPVATESSEAVGWSAQVIESAAFALLAWLRYRDKPGNLPATTGARRPVLCGQITAP